jgi:hypothetical protein
MASILCICKVYLLNHENFLDSFAHPLENCK